ncbi:M28 family metallopeptidase [bacterium]|nr:M28 family metallopeptidase [bacterium]
MIRREFLRYTSRTALATFLTQAWSCSGSKNTRRLVDTPEKRAQYLKNMLGRLCTDIGPHTTGTPEMERAATIIRDELKAGIPLTDFDRYTFEKWELVGKPEFFVGETSLEAVPRHGCAGTSPEGIYGIIRRTEAGGYVIADEVSGKIIATIAVSPYGRAIPGFASVGSLTGFGIGKQDIPVLDSAAADKTPVRAVAQVRFVPGMPGCNVAATIPGTSSDEILFLAHADTVYTSPGANDNTASALVMIMMAHAFSGTKPKHTLTFVATDGEEYGLLGARHYAERRRQEGTLGNIKFITNFDSLTYGPNLWVTSLDSELREMLRTINEDLKINGTPRFSDEDGYILDNAPFRDSGARAVNMNSRGYDDLTLPVYHRPEDTAETVHEDCVENSFLVFTEYIRRLEAMKG